jgi:hypothetical protein
MNANDFPGFICSGQISRPPNTTTDQVGSFLRVRIAIVFEFVTLSTAFNARNCRGSTAMVDAALQLAYSQPRAMDNPKHESWFRSFIKDTGKFVRDNQSWIAPLASAGMMLL